MEGLALLFFFLQQLGMTLGVGASTFAVMLYIIANADGRLDDSEQTVMHAVYVTLRIGLYLILASGIAITGAHVLAGDVSLIERPIYLFKWLLIGVLIVNGVLLSMSFVSRTVGGTIAGASWYALFAIHTLAIDLSWTVLISVYALWLLLFAVAFRVLADTAVRRHRTERLPAGPGVAPLPTGPHISFTLPSKQNKD